MKNPMTDEQKFQRSELIRKVCDRLKEVDVDDSSLDGAVHDAKATEASDINNGGMAAQVAYLIGDGDEDTPEAVDKAFNDIIVAMQAAGDCPGEGC